jgi:succinoglycan biosynthesis transport protein ExoP
MENDQRLTPLPQSVDLQKSVDLQTASNGYASVYSSFYDDESFEGKRSIRQYINVVYKRLPIILAITLIVTSAVALYMYRLPPIYEATAEMIIEPPKAPVTGTKDSININFGSDVNYENTQLQLLRSPDLMKDVVVDLGLYRDPDLFGSQNKGLLSSLRSIISRDKTNSGKDNLLPVVEQVPDSNGEKPKVVLTPEEESRANAYAAILLTGLSVEPVERTNIVNVSIKSENPVIAAKVADRVAQMFKEQDAQRQSAGARQAYEDLKKSIDTLTQTINSDDAELIKALKDYNLPLQDKGQELNASRLQGLSETWMKALENRRQLEARYNAALQASNRGDAVNIPDISSNPIYIEAVKQNRERKAKLEDDIRAVQKQRNDLETKYQANSTKWTDEHPEMKALLAQIESLKKTEADMQKEVANIVDQEQKTTERKAVGGALISLKSQLDAARTQESQSKAAFDAEAASANDQGQKMTHLTTLKRQIETNRTLLDTYTQRQKEQELAIASNKPNNIQISADAVTPGSPIGPNRGRNIFIAFLVSFAAGIGLAFLLDYLDDSVKSSDDIGRHLALPTLALIPHYLTTEKRRLALAPANGNGGGIAAAALISLQERNSPMAEAYRHLRTSLLFSSAGKPPKTILVTSSQPAEGKTTTAINTAVTLAQADAEVIIIDCDLRRPRVHNYFNLDNTHGLTNYLSGERDTENLIKSYPELPKLKVITSGPIPPNPAELLSSNEMKNLLQFLSGRFRHVIIDSPPAISFTDAAILSTLVDGVVLVAMANKSSLHLMRRFKQRLGNIGARIYGVVLNGIKSGSMEYEYYGSGYYNYYNRSDDDLSTPLMEDVETMHTTNGSR